MLFYVRFPAADSPATVSLSSSASPTTASNVFTVTATFSSAVSGVAVADFNGGTAFPTETGVSYALAGGPTEYVLTVTADASPRADKSWSFNVAAGSGTISPPNAAASSTLPVA